MLEWKRLTNPEVDALDRRLPVLIPVGLIEAHGPHLSLSVDLDTAEFFSREIAGRTGAILAPGMPYGFGTRNALNLRGAIDTGLNLVGAITSATSATPM